MVVILLSPSWASPWINIALKCTAHAKTSLRLFYMRIVNWQCSLKMKRREAGQFIIVNIAMPEPRRREVERRGTTSSWKGIHVKAESKLILFKGKPVSLDIPRVNIAARLDIIASLFISTCDIVDGVWGLSLLQTTFPPWTLQTRYWISASY